MMIGQYWLGKTNLEKTFRLAFNKLVGLGNIPILLVNCDIYVIPFVIVPVFFSQHYDTILCIVAYLLAHI